MVELEVLSIVRDIVAILGVVGGFTYYVMTVKASQRTQKQNLETRHAQLFMQFFDRYNTIENNLNFNMLLDIKWTDFEDYHKNISLGENKDRQARIDKTLGQYEAIGVLVEEGFIDVRILANYMGSDILQIYEKFSPIFEEYRARLPNWLVYNKFDYLYKEIKKLRPDTPKYSDTLLSQLLSKQ